MLEQTITQLRQLKLTGMADALPGQIEQPGTYEGLSFEQRIQLLADSEAQEREQRKQKRLIKAARFKLERIIEWRGKPKTIRCDNGPEYISQKVVDRAKAQDIKRQYIQPGNPQQNAYVERFNRTVRHEWLNQFLFNSIEHAQETVTCWKWSYNNERPHTAIGGVPPRQKLVLAC